MLVPRVWEDRAAAALRPLRPGPELLKSETGWLLLLLSWADASAVLTTASVDTFAVTADGTVVSAVASAVTAAVSANVSAADSTVDPKDAAAVSAVDLLLILKILLLFLPSPLLFPPAIRARSRCHVLPSKPPPKSRSPSCSSEL